MHIFFEQTRSYIPLISQQTTAPRDNPSARRSKNNTTQNGYSGEHNFERMPLQQFYLDSISHARRRRRPRPLIVFIIIVHDGRGAAGSDRRASMMVLWIGRCGGCGEAGERRRWGGRLMGSGGCVRSKGGTSRRSAAAGEGVETSGSSNYGDIL